jgi:hypothetical protein
MPLLLSQVYTAGEESATFSLCCDEHRYNVGDDELFWMPLYPVMTPSRKAFS